MRILGNFYYKLHALKLRFCKRNLKIALSAQVRPNVEFGQNIKIGKNTWLHGSVGSYSYIGEGCRLNADIGKFCSISPNVKTVAATHPVNFLSTAPVFFSSQRQCGVAFTKECAVEEGLYYDKERAVAVKIGNDVWIGNNVLIKSGVIIGDGAIVAAGAVVIKDVPPYSVVGGVPAKVIRYRFEQKIISELLEFKWWNRDIDYIKQQEHCNRET